MVGMPADPMCMLQKLLMRSSSAPVVIWVRDHTPSSECSIEPARLLSNNIDLIMTGKCAAQYNMTKESVNIYQERMEMSKTIAAAVEKKATAAEKASTGCVTPNVVVACLFDQRPPFWTELDCC